MKTILSRLRKSVVIAPLLCLGIHLLAGAGEAKDDGPWERNFFTSPAQALLAAATAVPTPEKGGVVVLLDEGSFSFDGEGRCITRYRMAYRIINQTGVEGWAAISAGWSPWYQDRPSLQARVVSPDGVEHRLSQDTISDAPAKQASSDVYSDRRVVQAPLPAVAVGAVVEQEIVIREKTPLFAAGSLHRFYLGNSSRTLNSRMIIDFPATLPIKHRVYLLPQLSMSKREKDGRITLTFQSGPMEPLEALEPNIPGEITRWPNVAFTTARSWPEVARQYGEVVAGRIKGSDLSALVRETVGEVKDREKIAALLLARLHKDVRYTGIEFGSASIIPRTPDETLRQKYGDCKDQAALLVKMLRTAGVPAQVALIRGGEGEDIAADLPGLEGFNHAIVYLPGNSPIWIDPTATYRPAGELPLGDQGKLAMVAGGEFSSLLVTPEAPSAENRQEETREFSLTEKGKARVIETTRMWGSIGASYRGDYGSADQKTIRKTLEDYGKSEYLADKLTTVESSDPGKVNEPFRIRLEMDQATRGFTDDDEALVAISPTFALRRLPSELIEEEKTKAAERKQDYLLHEPYVFEARYRIVPPPGFANQALPQSDSLDLGPMMLQREYAADEDGSVTAVIRFDTGKRRLTPDEFDAVKAAVKSLKEEKTTFVRFQQVGRSLLAAGKFSEALAEFRQLSLLHPGEALHHVQIAETLLEMGLRDAALKEAERAVAVEPASAQAHRAVAWILQHDAIGRRQLKGMDRKRAISEYRKAKELDPEDFSARGDLAIILEHGPDGTRYGRGADLAGAIAEYRAIRTDLKRNEMDENLLACLYRAERWTELKEAALAPDGPENVHLYVVLAVAGEEGAEAALKEAYQRIPDPAKRREALSTVASSLIAVRHYGDAVALLEETAKGAANAVALRGRIKALRNVKPFEQVSLADDDVTTVVKRLFLSIFVPASAPDSLNSLFASDVREEVKDGTIDPAFAYAVEKAMKEDGPPREVVADLALSALEFRVSGSDAVGYRIDADSGTISTENKLRLYAVKEDGRYRIVAEETKPAVMGLEVLRRLEKGDLTGAKTWLDWAREAAPRNRDDDPLSEEPFLKIWGQDASATPEHMRLAAAVLLADSGHDKAISILVKERTKSEGMSAAAMDLALARAYGEKKKYKEMLQLVERVAAAYPQSVTAFIGRAHALRMMGRWDEVAAIAEERLARMPKDPAAIRVLASCAEQKGAFDQAASWYKVLVDAGAALSADYNNLAWLELFRETISPEALTNAERAVAMSGGKDEGSLHTLAAVYAEAGRTAEARETILKTLSVSDTNEPKSRHWYVLGRIAEQYGEMEAAREAYARVEKPDAEVIVANSTYALARKRLEMGLRKVEAKQALRGGEGKVTAARKD
nr:DUF3857 domain-containing protein [Geotalea sp. SG265]